MLSRGSRRPRAPPFLDPPGYARHRPETTLLYRLVEQHYPSFRELRAESGRPLPGYAEQEFEAYLKCGRLEHGFLRVRCGECHAAKLVAFSCKRRGFCPSCGARRMAEAAALLVDEVLPARPLRQWVLSLPHALRFLLATNPAALTEVLGVVYLPAAGGPPVFRHLPAPTGAQLQVVVQRIAERVGHVLERRGLVERGVGAAKHPPADPAKPATPHHVAMNWARWLKRVFGVEIEACVRYGGQPRIIVSIEEPEVIAKILAHLEPVAPEQYSAEWPPGARAPPLQARLL